MFSEDVLRAYEHDGECIFLVFTFTVYVPSEGCAAAELFCELPPSEGEVEVFPAAEEVAVLSVSAFAVVSNSLSGSAALVTR